MLLFFMLIVLQVIRIDGNVYRKPVFIRGDDEISKSEDVNNNNENLFEKVKQLVDRLHRYQRDEAQLKMNIKEVTSMLHSGNEKQRRKIKKRKVCNCKHHSLNDVIHMLDLPSNQTELLVRLVELMKQDTSQIQIADTSSEVYGKPKKNTGFLQEVIKIKEGIVDSSSAQP